MRCWRCCHEQEPSSLSVANLAWLYIGVGTSGSFAHMTELQARNLFRFDGVWIELTEVTAVICGVFFAPPPQLGSLACACLDSTPHNPKRS
jgi:hypothetical protein